MLFQYRSNFLLEQESRCGIIIHMITLIIITMILLIPLVSQGQELMGEKINYDSGFQIIQKNIKEGKIKEADTLLRVIFSQYPGYTELLSFSARVLFCERRYGESIETYKALLEINPSDEIKKE